jgi:hypothetical protein
MSDTVLGETHYAVLERLSDGMVHWPFREMKIYDGLNTLLSQNEIMEISMQMADQDLRLVDCSGGDCYFHERITPLGLAMYKELHVSEDKEAFTNPETYEPVDVNLSNSQGKDRQRKLDDLSKKLGL